MICPASREWTDNRPAMLPAGQLSIIIKKKREHLTLPRSRNRRIKRIPATVNPKNNKGIMGLSLFGDSPAVLKKK